jgi:hypothetical protein
MRGSGLAAFQGAVCGAVLLSAVEVIDYFLSGGFTSAFSAGTWGLVWGTTIGTAAAIVLAGFKSENTGTIIGISCASVPVIRAGVGEKLAGKFPEEVLLGALVLTLGPSLAGRPLYKAVGFVLTRLVIIIEHWKRKRLRRQERKK